MSHSKHLAPPFILVSNCAIPLLRTHLIMSKNRGHSFSLDKGLLLSCVPHQKETLGTRLITPLCNFRCNYTVLSQSVSRVFLSPILLNTKYHRFVLQWFYFSGKNPNQAHTEVCRLPLVELPPTIPPAPSAASDLNQNELKQTSSRRDRDTSPEVTSEGDGRRFVVLYVYLSTICILDRLSLLKTVKIVFVEDC